MGSEIPLQQIESAGVDVEAPMPRDRGIKKNQDNVPGKIHKAEREKLKRDQLNELFLNLADALDLTEPNTGKASILNEATRLLKDLVYQIDCLRKENISLLSESRYVTTEKNELIDENYALRVQNGELRNEVKAAVEQSKPDLNVPPPVEYTSDFRAHVIQGPTVEESMTSRAASNVRKPHARYPTPADSWPSQLLIDRQRQDFNLGL